MYCTTVSVPKIEIPTYCKLQRSNEADIATSHYISQQDNAVRLREMILGPACISSQCTDAGSST